MTESISVQTQRSRLKIEGTMGDRRETLEGRGKGHKIHLDSTQAMLSDLARGQRDLLTFIQQMNLSAQMLQHSMRNIGSNPPGGPSGSGGH